MTQNSLRVIAADAITEWLSSYLAALPELVGEVYLHHLKGKTNNPDSYFLRFPGDSMNRIIALPCSLEDDAPIAGVKWIASFPDNIHRGLDRASAVIVVNDRYTGYPLALLEGSLISIARTAASATLGALQLHPTPKLIENLTVVGCGPISAATISQMLACNIQINRLTLIDLDINRANKLITMFQVKISQCKASTDISELLQSDLILFATSASAPHVNDTKLFAHNPTVLHISLRDLDPVIIIGSQNITDDTSHCLKANTSLHLAVKQQPKADFISGTLADVMLSNVKPVWSKPRIYSPFGMGILDLAIARKMLEDKTRVRHTNIENFFPAAFEG
jgi:2,3-diaminopropionate biosynthesis protein SbnB